MDSVRRKIALERKYGVLLKALESEQKARKGKKILNYVILT